MGNEIFEARTRGVGVIPAEMGLAYGLSGANIRASGVDWDLRRDAPSPLVWSELDWKVWTHPDGDSFARYWVRLQEVREATKMVDQLLDGLPAGPIRPRCPASSRCPRARRGPTPRTRWARWATTSSARAAWARSGSRSARPRFNNVSIVPWLLKGVYVPDIITILASLYFILGDIDR